MPNGNLLYTGRATGSIFTGRASPRLGAGFPAPAAPWATFSNGGRCTPIQQCCCKGPVTIAPGEIQSITLNWGAWIDSVPGYQLTSVAEASLYDMTEVTPPAPADPSVIKIVSGIEDDPNPDNGDAGDLICVVPPYGAQVLIEASKDARIGAQYKLTICMVARDCDGRKIRQCDCVVITIAEC